MAADMTAGDLIVLSAKLLLHKGDMGFDSDPVLHEDFCVTLTGSYQDKQVIDDGRGKAR